MGAGAANFNEIRFDDKKGSEQLFIHAEKNQDRSSARPART
jgi:type VI secretion system secreted protein VgrG